MTASHPAVPASASSSWDVVIRPVKSRRIGQGLAAFVFLLFLGIGLSLPDTHDSGVQVNGADQWGMIGVGVILAALLLCFTRPRVRVGPAGIENRTHFGNAHLIEWPLVQRVEFAPKGRFARVVLPADELVTLYAITRGDAEHSVANMRTIRELFDRYS